MKVLAVLPVLFAFLAGALPAHAWTWPVEGPVLQPFLFGSDPYAAGQHRGVDIGAPSGDAVRAPAGGVVSFAGAMPQNGRSVTIATAGGYSVTLVHLGSIAVSRGVSIDEGATVGTVGPSGDAEHSEPYVHLGVRVSADPHGYVDPLGLLPARPGAPAETSGEPAPDSGDPGPAEAPASDATSTAHDVNPDPSPPETPAPEAPTAVDQPVADAPVDAPVASPAEGAEAPQAPAEAAPDVQTEPEPAVESPLPAGEAHAETSVPPAETSVPAVEPTVPSAEPSAPSESPAAQPTGQAPDGESSTQPEASEPTPSAETTVPSAEPSVPAESPEAHPTGQAPAGEPSTQPEAAEPTPSAETTVPPVEPSAPAESPEAHPTGQAPAGEPSTQPEAAEPTPQYETTVPAAEPSVPAESPEAQPTGQAPGGEPSAEPEVTESSGEVGAHEEPTAAANAGPSEAGERIAPTNPERGELGEREPGLGRAVRQLPTRATSRISAEVAGAGARASRLPKGRTEPALAPEGVPLPRAGSTADELAGKHSGEGRLGFLVTAGAGTSALLAALAGALILRARVRRRTLADVPPALAHGSAGPCEQGPVGAADVDGDAVRTPLDTWLDELLSGKPTCAGSHSTGAPAAGRGSCSPTLRGPDRVPSQLTRWTAGRGRAGGSAREGSRRLEARLRS